VLPLREDSAVMWKDLKPEEIWEVIKRPLLILVLAVLLRVGYQESWVVHDLVHMLADAIAVGMVIGLTIELFFSGLLVERTAFKLSEKLVGMGLPSDLQGVISNIVHSTMFVHHNSKVRYSIRSSPQDAKTVLVTIEWSYDVYNYGKTSEEYTPSLGDEHVHEPEFLSLDCAHGNNVYSLSAADLKTRITRETDSQSLNVKGNKVILEHYELKMGRTTDLVECHGSSELRSLVITQTPLCLPLRP
jgi:hypothetical protein